MNKHLTDTEFIEDMKTYKIDHAPDGWPAVQQWKIDRLLDIISSLKGELVLAEQDACQLRNIGVENIMTWHDKANRYDKIMEVINER